MRSFTKVRGNENNARAVVAFVLEASQILANKVLYLHDEGDALYCPLLIKNGLVKPDTSDMTDSIEYWEKEADCEALKEGGAYDVTDAARYYKALLSNPPDWGSVKQYIRPFKDGGEYAEAKPFNTVGIEQKDMVDLPSLITNFLAEELSESLQFYDSTTTYPIEIEQ